MEGEPEPKAKAHPVPPPRAHDLEKAAVGAAWKAKELVREKQKVELRGAERLAMARERHKAFRARQVKDREYAAEVLQRDIARAQEHLLRTQAQTVTTIEEMEAESGQYEVQEAEAHLAKQRAQQQVFGVREEAASHASRTERDVALVVRESHEAVEARKAEVKTVVGAQRADSLQFKERLREEIATREVETKAYVEELLLQTKSSLRQKEHERHHAVAHLDRVAELHQTTKTEAQARIKLHEEKSRQQVKELEKMTYQLRLRSDEALAQKMYDTTSHLASAKSFCAEVKMQMGEEIRLAKLSMAQIEEQAAVNTRHEQRKVQELEQQALGSFKACMEEASSTWHQTNAQRQSLQVELEALHAKYQSLHDATQTKMKNILEEWGKDRESMEEKVKVCEERRKEAFEVVSKAMKQSTDTMEAKNRELQEECVELVLQSQRRNEDEAFVVRENALEAQKAEQRRAEETLREAMQWKAQIEGIEEKADEEISAYELRAQTMEAQMEKDAQAQVNLSKRLAQTAHEEEKVYITETANAWARVRKACYQLRLASLHDFAKGIVAGHFDASE